MGHELPTQLKYKKGLKAKNMYEDYSGFKKDMNKSLKNARKSKYLNKINKFLYESHENINNWSKLINT